MRTYLLLLAFVLSVPDGFAQRHRLPEVNAQTPEGQLLQQALQESDDAKKLALLEKFSADFPKHEAVGPVLELSQELCLKLNQPDKALAAGEKLMAMNPTDVESAHQTLKAAEMKADPDQVKKWSAIASEAALKVVGSPQPKEEAEVENWKRRVDYARQVNTYTEYSLYAMALRTADPKKKVELMEELEKRNPKSEYLAKGASQLFLAYRQAGENDKAVALAEKILATDQSDEDMMLVVADSYLQKKTNPEQLHAYTSKIVELLNSKPKPEGVADADWQKRKETILGVAHYISGKQYYGDNKFAPADQELRAALSRVGGNLQMKAEVLFLLGVANYKMEKIQDAATFSQQCAAIKSPFQAAAAKNLAAIKRQYTGVK